MSLPNHPIYLDNHATTPVDPRVIQAMRPFWEAQFANPASAEQADDRGDQFRLLRASLAQYHQSDGARRGHRLLHGSGMRDPGCAILDSARKRQRSFWAALGRCGKG